MASRLLLIEDEPGLVMTLTDRLVADLSGDGRIATALRPFVPFAPNDPGVRPAA